MSDHCSLSSSNAVSFATKRLSNALQPASLCGSGFELLGLEGRRFETRLDDGFDDWKYLAGSQKDMDRHGIEHLMGRHCFDLRGRISEMAVRGAQEFRVGESINLPSLEPHVRVCNYGVEHCVYGEYLVRPPFGLELAGVPKLERTDHEGGKDCDNCSPSLHPRCAIRAREADGDQHAGVPDIDSHGIPTSIGFSMKQVQASFFDGSLRHLRTQDLTLNAPTLFDFEALEEAAA